MSSRKADYSPEAWERHKARERKRKAAKADDPVWRAAQNASIYRYVQRRKEILDKIRVERGCIDCGTHEGSLHFDHRDGEVKLFKLGASCRSLERLMAEVAKCDVRCASCHATRHHRARRELSHH